MHGILFPLSILCLVILLLVFLLKKFNQPYLVAYMLAGILLGPYALGVFKEATTIEGVGELGVMLLMFFLGMEINIPDRKSQLLHPLIVQGGKTAVCLGVAWIIGRWLGWTMPVILLLTILLTFNSTVVVSEFLKKNNELRTAQGNLVLNILLLQDVLLAPVLTLFQFLGPAEAEPFKWASATAGSLLIFLMLRAIRNRNLYQLPFVQALQDDHDLQVFAAACICLGFGLLASLMGLTSAIGSFAAGIYIGRTRAFHWLETVLRPFKIFFTALFFVSIGIMLDVQWVIAHMGLVLVLTLLVILINSILGAGVFRLLGYAWPKSIYAGALLSQTGEFGLLACSLAWQMGIIPLTLFKAGLAITILSLLISTIWMTVIRQHITNKKALV